MGRTKRILIVRNKDMREFYRPYVKALRKAGFRVSVTPETDRVADERQLGQFSLILIQFGLLITEKHHTRGTLDGGCNGGAVALALRKRGVRLPILLCNLGLEELTRAYRDPKKRIEALHLHDCAPQQFAQECLNHLEISSPARRREAPTYTAPQYAVSI